MKDFKWKIVFTIQVLSIIFIGGILSYKMGIFKDLKSHIIHEAIAEEPLKLEPKVSNVVLVKEIKEEIKEEIKKPSILIKKTNEEVKKVMEKYKDQVKDSYIATVTSYNSEPGQTDDTPCITASGMDVCKRDVEDIVATNDLPFHTKILIPEYFGDRIFYVEDRMNKRFTGMDRLDVWMKNKVDSKNFGAKVLKIIVLK